jgi:major membrane immunogen (membrane-anchored lipoprotein)
LKTFVTILSVLAFALLITACRKQDQKPEPSPAPTANTESTPGPAASASPTPGPEAKPKETKYDFRRADWGMTMAEVKASESKKPADETADSLTYTSRVGKMFAYVTYQFKDGKLYRAGFIFDEKRDTDQKFLDDYETIKQELTKVNGKPVIDGVKQINPDADVASQDRGAAVCRGDLAYGAQWNIPRTVIRLFLQGKDSKCILTAIYTSASAEQSTADMNGTGGI